MKIWKVLAAVITLFIVLPLAVLLLVPQPAPVIDSVGEYRATKVLVENVDFDKRATTAVEYSGSGFYEWAGVAKLIFGLAGGNPNSLALISGSEFSNGTIEVDINATIVDELGGMARGFSGVAFRVSDDLQSYEAVYLRPANGRTDDPVRRAHAVQYISHPEFHFDKSRKETPGKYEVPADIGLEEWIKLRVDVKGGTAAVSVNGKIVLEIDDLKLGARRSGGVALWVNPGTRAYFSNLKITPETQ